MVLTQNLSRTRQQYIPTSRPMGGAGHSYFRPSDKSVFLLRSRVKAGKKIWLDGDSVSVEIRNWT
jgi:hypothetical protein